MPWLQDLPMDIFTKLSVENSEISKIRTMFDFGITFVLASPYRFTFYIIIIHEIYTWVSNCFFYVDSCTSSSKVVGNVVGNSHIFVAKIILKDWQSFLYTYWRVTYCK